MKSANENLFYSTNANNWPWIINIMMKQWPHNLHDCFTSLKDIQGEIHFLIQTSSCIYQNSYRLIKLFIFSILVPSLYGDNRCEHTCEWLTLCWSCDTAGIEVPPPPPLSPNVSWDWLHLSQVDSNVRYVGQGLCSCMCTKMCLIELPRIIWCFRNKNLF